MFYPRRRTRALALAAAICIAPAVAAQASEHADEVVAIVNGQEITRGEVEMLHRTLPQMNQVPLQLVFDALVEHLVDSRLVTEAARARDVHDSDEVKAAMRQYEDQVVRRVYLSKLVDEHISEDSLRARYDVYVENNPPIPEVRARHILVESEEEAREIIAELEDGADFAETARNRSIGPSASAGGDLGFFSEDEMVPAFAQAAFAMEPGETSKEPVQSQFGWHVIKVEEARMGEVAGFDQMEEQLRTQIAEDIIQEVIDELREGASIEILVSGPGMPGLPEQSGRSGR